MAHPEDSAKAFLKGLATRKRQPWDDVAAYSDDRGVPAPPGIPSPKPAPPTQPADEAMGQAERIAERNRDIAKRTRHLRD